MHVVVPYSVTSSVLIASNLTENDQPEWSSGTTYAEGALVMSTATHRIYESLEASNVGFEPSANPTKWLDLAATNRFAMFDYRISSQTVSAYNTPITIALRPADIINSLGLINMDASSVEIQVVNAAGVTVYTKSIDLYIPTPANHYEYCFPNILFKRFLVVEDIPPYADGTIYVTITPNGTGYAKVGFCMIGKAAFLGEMEYESGGGLRNFSSVTTSFGEDTFTARPSSGTLNAKLWVDTFRHDTTNRICQTLPAKVCLFVGTDVFESANIVGFLTDFKYSHQDGSHSIFNIEINGIT